MLLSLRYHGQSWRCANKCERKPADDSDGLDKDIDRLLNMNLAALWLQLLISMAEMVLAPNCSSNATASRARTQIILFVLNIGITTARKNKEWRPANWLLHILTELSRQNFEKCEKGKQRSYCESFQDQIMNSTLSVSPIIRECTHNAWPFILVSKSWNTRCSLKVRTYSYRSNLL
jgi:hypothetical protein